MTMTELCKPIIVMHVS